VYRVSGGNPFYIEQLARAGGAVSADAQPAGSEALGASIPAAVRRELAAEITTRATFVIEDGRPGAVPA
jgi:hypothetical protein